MRLTAVASVMLSTVGYAQSGGWTANPGTRYENGLVILDSRGQPAGTSYENQNLNVQVANGDTISFDYSGPCGGGAPRVFIQGGAYNTFDQDPNGTACGSDPDSDGFSTVTQTISGITNGTAGHTGIVNDNISNPSVITVRNLRIAGQLVLPPANADECKKGGFTRGGFRNQGQCVSSFNRR